MRLDQLSKKVLITGIDSFTGIHLSKYLQMARYDVYGTSYLNESEKTYKCDITKKEDIKTVLKAVDPDYVIHLSGISYAAFEDSTEFYKVNTIGTINILDAILEMNLNPSKILIASSATVYGNQGLEVLDESLCPTPVNHYGASKYAMESMVKNYFNKLNIIVTRPFNYTGMGQAEHFLIPKIVKHFKDAKKEIELGNLHVSREFNDITFVCEIYSRFLNSTCKSEIVNICSDRGVKLLDIIDKMNLIAGYAIEVKVNPAFVRKDEIKTLTGSSKKLFGLIGKVKQKTLDNTLRDMFENCNNS